MLSLAVGASSCTTDDLMVESQTSITSQFLYNTPEGLSRAVVGLYKKDRSCVINQDEGGDYEHLMMDFQTDLMAYRAGNAAAMFRLNSAKSSTDKFKTVWERWYQIIGKANEVIYYAKQLDPDLENETVKRAYGEALLFRARCYFGLYKHFEKVYLNLIPTTVDNMEGRTYRPSSKNEVFKQIKLDLEEAIECLDWIVPNGDYGRMTKAVAHHVRAQVAMWEGNWQDAIDHCEAIFTNGSYSMMPTMADVFNGANLNNSEVLYAYQFSKNPGGAASIDDGVAKGHRLSLITTPGYSKIDGLEDCTEYGGYGWGRTYPNARLFSLYGATEEERTKDNRYTTMFRHQFYYNNEKTLPEGKTLGEAVNPTENKSLYTTSLHPCSLKFFDGWTIEDFSNRTSFKDVIVYRLAETYLMAAEAYFLKYGSCEQALKYYNMTYSRAMSTKDTVVKWTKALTLDDILDEYARELHLEGVRWQLLKRHGLLAEYVKKYAGESVAENPYLTADLIDPRVNWDDKWYCWPIPQSFLDVVGESYGQNRGW